MNSRSRRTPSHSVAGPVCAQACLAVGSGTNRARCRVRPSQILTRDTGAAGYSPGATGTSGCLGRGRAQSCSQSASNRGAPAARATHPSGRPLSRSGRRGRRPSRRSRCCITARRASATAARQQNDDLGSGRQHLQPRGSVIADGTVLTNVARETAAAWAARRLSTSHRTARGERHERSRPMVETD